MPDYPQILRAARAKIQKSKHWTTGAFAKDKNGEVVSPTSDKAICWCAFGAVKAVASEFPEQGGAVNFLYDTLRENRKLFGHRTSLFEVNDSSTHRQILKLFDLAIKSAEEKAKAEGNA